MDEAAALCAVQEMLAAIGEALDESEQSYIADTIVDDPSVALEDVLGALLPFDKLHDACQRLAASIQAISTSSNSPKVSEQDDSLPVRLAAQVTIGGAPPEKKTAAPAPKSQAEPIKKKEPSADPVLHQERSQGAGSPELGKIEALDLVSTMEGRKEGGDDGDSEDYSADDEDRFDVYREDMDAGFFGSQNSRFAIDRTGCSRQVHLRGLFLAFRSAAPWLNGSDLILFGCY